MTVKEFLSRYDEGERFDEKELEEIFDCDLDEESDDRCYIVEDKYDEPRRWQRSHWRWVEINDRYSCLAKHCIRTDSYGGCVYLWDSDIPDLYFYCYYMSVSFFKKAKRKNNVG